MKNYRWKRYQPKDWWHLFLDNPPAMALAALVIMIIIFSITAGCGL